MSPEQSFGTSVDHRTDLWSVGVVLYEMLTGERPFRGERQEAILLAIRSQPLQLPAEISRALPKGVLSIVERCLEKDPERRYATAEDLEADLRQVREGQSGSLKAGAGGTSKLVSAPGRLSRPRVMQIVAATILVAAGVGATRVLMMRQGEPANKAPVTTGSADTRLASNVAEAGSIAVLPFANMSPSPDRDYIGDGIADELIHALTRVPNLRVVSRTSSFQYKGVNVDVREVGAKLGVASVLEGSVRSAGDRLRVTVQLIDARNGYELWSEAFDRSMKDIFDVQEEISRAVVDKLRITNPGGCGGRLAKRSTDDPEAYALYLKGRQLWNQRRQLPQAIKYFQQAIARDSSFALGYLGLGQAWINLPFYSNYPLAPAQDSARAAILKSLALDSTLAEAYASLGSMAADSWRWKEAEPYFHHALALTGGGGDATTRQWYGEMLLKTGRLDEAVREFRVAHKLNPLSAVITSNLGWALYSAGHYEEAIAAFKSAIELDSSFAHPLDGLASVYLEQQRYKEAIAQFERADALMYGGQGTRAYLGRGYALGGRQPEAEAVLAQLEKEASSSPTSGSPWGVALIAVSLGRNDEAMKWLERAYQVRDFALAYLKVDPAFKPLSSDPRFAQLLAKMGFE
jgi:serine/threonine-protein kinase